MATKRQRLNVTLSDEVHALIEEFHSLTGASKSGFVSEMLDQIAPVFRATVEALKIVNEQPVEAQRLIKDFAAETMGSLSQATLDMEQSVMDLDAAMDARTMQGKRARRRRDGSPKN